MRLLLLVGAACISPLQGAAAQYAPAATLAGPADEPAEIVVTAPYQRDLFSSLTGVSVVTGATLTRDLRPTIGETLQSQPGVSATSFGPNASRPVLRGLQGERVRVLTDGIGSFDLANTSVDHAVVINPLTADRIEVLRGPAALLYGSAAIGGVVNVSDSRIPRLRPGAPELDLLATYGSAADERAFSGKVNAPLVGRLVAHLDGSYSETNDLQIGGPVLTRGLRDAAAGSGAPDIARLAALTGRIPNSGARTWEAAGSLAWVGADLSLGASIGRYDNLYGVPVRFAVTPGIESERVQLHIQQTREDVRAEWRLHNRFVEALRFRAGYADYYHEEQDALAGGVNTQFFSKSYEGRAELAQAAHGGWKGAIGGQFLNRKLNIVGDEKFLPRNTTDQFGIFALQEYSVGPLKAEIGGRYEHSRLTADADAQIGNPATTRDFDSFSGSLGASYELVDDFRLGLSLSHSERAPAAEELFADGPHGGTQAFESGSPDFGLERSNGIEATARVKQDSWSLDASLYYTRFQGFIIESPTGAIVDNLPVFQFAQSGARFVGLEIEGSSHVADLGEWTLVADGLVDLVRARILQVGPVPRIPPLRVLAGLEAQSDAVKARLEVEWDQHQRRIAAFETPTDAFTLVNASISWTPFDNHPGTSLLVSANNLLDVVARRHASFLKDYAPLAGRDVRVTGRLSF